MSRLDWVWYRWTNPLHCHGVLAGPKDAPTSTTISYARPCTYIATGPFKPWAMRRHQRKVHGG